MTGHLEAGRRVKVASVPSVNLLDSSARKRDLSPSLFTSGTDLFHFSFVWFQDQIISVVDLGDEPEGPAPSPYLG